MNFVTKTVMLITLLSFTFFSCEESLDEPTIDLDQVYSEAKNDFSVLIVEMKKRNLNFLQASEVEKLTFALFPDQAVLQNSIGLSNGRIENAQNLQCSEEFKAFLVDFQNKLSSFQSFESTFSYLNDQIAIIEEMPVNDDSFLKASVVMTAKLVLETYESTPELFLDYSAGRIECGVTGGAIGAVIGAAAGTILGGLLGSAIAPGAGTAAGAYAGFKTGAIAGAAIGGAVGAVIGYVGGC